MKNKLLPVILSVLLLASCGGNQQKNEKSVISQPDQATDTKAGSQQQVHPGKKVYDAVCLVCHMADGSGVPGMHPPIYESEFVNGNKTELINIVLKGKSGKVEVKGEVYNGIMPPQAHLSNQQIADVLTYMRSNFENDAGPILPEEVQKLRE